MIVTPKASPHFTRRTAALDAEAPNIVIQRATHSARKLMRYTCVTVPGMPPTKIKPRRDFDSSLSGYLESIQEKKTALLAAVNRPSKENDKQYHAAAQKEKLARREYRKATKSLYAVTQRSRPSR